MLSSNQLIERRFKNKIVSIEGGELLFKLSDGLKIVDEIEHLKAIILGIDFWQLVNGNYVEVNSTDWSSINKGNQASKDTIEAARQLFKNGLTDDSGYVSFVLEDKFTK